MVAKTVEAAFDPADESLVWVFLQPERPQHLIDGLHRTTQLPACRGENESVLTLRLAGTAGAAAGNPGVLPLPAASWPDWRPLR